MHPAVSKALFQGEVERWPTDLAESLGWIIHRVEYPVIDCEFKAAGRTPLRLFCDFSDWDDQPPSITLRSSDGENLTKVLPNATNIFHAGPHEKWPRPFICMAGTLEYHTHSSHINEGWEQYRRKPGYSMGDLLHKIWNAWRKGSG